MRMNETSYCFLDSKLLDNHFLCKQNVGIQAWLHHYVSIDKHSQNFSDRLVALKDALGTPHPPETTYN